MSNVSLNLVATCFFGGIFAFVLDRVAGTGGALSRFETATAILVLIAIAVGLPLLVCHLHRSYVTEWVWMSRSRLVAFRDCLRLSQQRRFEGCWRAAGESGDADGAGE